MPGTVSITPWHWAGFVVVILTFLALDLGVFHRSQRVIPIKEALRWSAVWFLLALVFAVGLDHWRGHEDSFQFLTAYLIEFTLSLDNLFAIALLFAAFGVAPALQHRVLYWGIAGAMLMRGMMIGAGAALLHSFHWLLFVLGALLVVAGLKWALAREKPVQPERNVVVRLARKFFPVSPDFDGPHFLTISNGRRALTPLALVLLAVETTDLVFATDSIPAIFAVTQNAFLIFTSNMLAILGLRSLYFVLVGAMRHFRYLRIGLAVVLILIGIKMLAARWYTVPAGVSLVVITALLALSIAGSVVAGRRERDKTNRR
ncbi:MAG: TerC family protein [Limisphaerales bacterium]